MEPKECDSKSRTTADLRYHLCTTGRS